MKRVTVRVLWKQGLHFRPAARLVRLARQFRSSITVRLGRSTADLTSILGVVGLCAMMGTPLEVEASGDDEDRAITAVARAFSEQDSGDDGAAAPVSPESERREETP